MKVGKDIRLLTFDGVNECGNLLKKALGVDGIVGNGRGEAVVTVQVFDRLTSGKKLFNGNACDDSLFRSKTQLLALVQVIAA